MGFPLPNELTGWIFNHLDVPSLLRCMQVCKLFHSIISMSIRLVYKIELYASCMEDNECSSLEAVNRLNLLREYNRVLQWHHTDWTSSGSIPMADDNFYWDFSGGILAQSTLENTLSFVQLPCKLKDIPERTWSIPFDFTICDFALDNSQDLIVLLELVGTSPNMSCQIHLRTLSGEQHPRTTVTQITYSSTILHNTFFAMQICGDHVAILFYAEGGWPLKSSFLLWNWRTGQQEVCIHAARFTSFAFMTEDLILAGIISPEMEPYLQVLRLTPHVDPVHSLEDVRYICKFLFPMVRGNADDLSIRSESMPTWKRPAGPGVPFYASQKDTIFTISLNILLDDAERMKDIVLFVPLSTLLLEVERSHGVLNRVVSWDTWGPDGTRLFFMRPSTIWTDYTCGMKFIRGLRQNNGHVAQVYDFNPYAARKHAETSVDSSTPWKRLAQQSKSVSDVFYEPVVTRLPGRVATITLTHSDEGWEAVMMGENHIVMVQSACSKYGYMTM